MTSARDANASPLEYLAETGAVRGAAAAWAGDGQAVGVSAARERHGAATMLPLLQ